MNRVTFVTLILLVSACGDSESGNPEGGSGGGGAFNPDNPSGGTGGLLMDGGSGTSGSQAPMTPDNLVETEVGGYALGPELDDDAALDELGGQATAAAVR